MQPIILRKNRNHSIMLWTCFCRFFWKTIWEKWKLDIFKNVQKCKNLQRILFWKISVFFEM